MCTNIDSLIPKQSSEHIKLTNSKNIRTYCGRMWDEGEIWWKAFAKGIDAKETFDEVSPLITEFAIPAIDRRIIDEQCYQILRSLAISFLDSGEEERLNIVLDKIGKIVQDNPDNPVIKRSYDTFIRERRWVDDGYSYIQECAIERE